MEMDEEPVRSLSSVIALMIPALYDMLENNYNNLFHEKNMLRREKSRVWDEVKNKRAIKISVKIASGKYDAPRNSHSLRRRLRRCLSLLDDSSPRKAMPKNLLPDF